MSRPDDDPYPRPPAGHGDDEPSPWARPPGGGEPPTAPLPGWAGPPAGHDDSPTMPLAGAEPPTAPVPGPYPPSGPFPPPAGPYSSGDPTAAYPPGPYQPGEPTAAYPPVPYPPGEPTAAYPPVPYPAGGGGGQWGAPPGYPVPPPRRSGRKVALIVGAVLVALLCPCLVLAGWLVLPSGDDDRSSAPSTAVPVDPTEEPTDEPTEEPTGEPPAPGGQDFAKGDCVVNDGTSQAAALRKVPCGPGAFEVLLRIPGTAEGDRCARLAPQATANYVSDGPLAEQDFVLCLRRAR
ncbi:LppU/SCO3897 family protein [Micromonospora mirobrigensis]|uniref:Uncharacterized protein n=1 Tax=Micromonospora mirobrigensis TaxID=262898 RepID=A0A1C5AD56_9ACTN|nr:hypothetical protein [Micromonospora mirobrigensis]SCF43167.1 hypothetical protein GA0070564_10969 [Micromonospora mirobrigensis]